jgi:hypothetical protein
VSVRRVALLTAFALLVSPAVAAAGSASWKLVKRGAVAQPGELAVVGAIVTRPGGVGVRVRASGAIAVNVVMSCRRGLVTRVGQGRLSGRAPYTRTLRLPLAGASNCAVSATGTNPAGTLALELLRG